METILALADSISEDRVDVVRQLFSEVLDVDIADVGGGTSFFDLGGTSVLALRLLWLLRKCGLQADVLDILRGPTPQEIAWVLFEDASLGDNQFTLSVR